MHTIDPTEHLELARGVALNWWKGGSQRLRAVADVDDVVSEAFAGLVLACRSYDGAERERSAVRGWLIQAIRWHLLDWYRSVWGRKDRVRSGRGDQFFARRFDEPLSPDLDTLTVGDTIADPDAARGFDRVDERVALAQVLDSERDPRFAYIARRVVHGATYAQIGRELGVTESRICQLLLRRHATSATARRAR